ncbi:Uncharacterised protein g6891 [Pycnogonum litorale]
MLAVYSSFASSSIMKVAIVVILCFVCIFHAVICWPTRRRNSPPPYFNEEELAELAGLQNYATNHLADLSWLVKNEQAGQQRVKNTVEDYIIEQLVNNGGLTFTPRRGR